MAHAEPLGGPAQREQCVPAAAGEVRLRLGASLEHRIELGRERGLRAPFDRCDTCPALLGLHLEPGTFARVVASLAQRAIAAANPLAYAVDASRAADSISTDADGSYARAASSSERIDAVSEAADSRRRTMRSPPLRRR